MIPVFQYIYIYTYIIHISSIYRSITPIFTFSRVWILGMFFCVSSLDHTVSISQNPIGHVVFFSPPLLVLSSLVDSHTHLYWNYCIIDHGLFVSHARFYPVTTHIFVKMSMIVRKSWRTACKKRGCCMTLLQNTVDESPRQLLIQLDTHTYITYVYIYYMILYIYIHAHMQ